MNTFESYLQIFEHDALLPLTKRFVIPREDCVALIFDKSDSETKLAFFDNECTEIELRRGQKACVLGRDVDFTRAFDVRFAGHDEGKVTLRFRIRILEPEQGPGHQILGKLKISRSADREDVGNGLVRAFGKTFECDVASYFSGISYAHRNWSSTELARFQTSATRPERYGFLLRNTGEDVVIESVESQEGEARLRALLAAEREIRGTKDEAEREKKLNQVRSDLELSEMQVAKIQEVALIRQEAAIQAESLAANGTVDQLRLERQIELKRLQLMKEAIELDGQLAANQKKSAVARFEEEEKRKLAVRMELLEATLERERLQTESLRIDIENRQAEKNVFEQSRQDEAQLQEGALSKINKSAEKQSARIAGALDRMSSKIEMLMEAAVRMENVYSKTAAQDHANAENSDVSISAVFKPTIRWQSFRVVRNHVGALIQPACDDCRNLDMLRSGQALRVTIRTNHDSYFYVLSLGKYSDFNAGVSRYSWKLLFGNGGKNDIRYQFSSRADHFLKVGQSICLPRDGEGWGIQQTYWPLDRNPGQEILFVVFTKARLDEDAVERLKAAPPSPRALRCRGILDGDSDWGAFVNQLDETVENDEDPNIIESRERIEEYMGPVLHIHGITFFHK